MPVYSRLKVDIIPWLPAILRFSLMLAVALTTCGGLRSQYTRHLAIFKHPPELRSHGAFAMRPIVILTIPGPIS